MLRFLSALLLVPALLVACSGGGDGVAMVEGQSFEPETITIAAGDTVVWTNETAEAHTVTAVEASLPEGATYFSSGGFSSEEAATFEADLAQGLLTEGETFEHEFPAPGTYRYYCIPHLAAGMTGTVIVEP